MTNRKKKKTETQKDKKERETDREKKRQTHEQKNIAKGTTDPRVEFILPK